MEHANSPSLSVTSTKAGAVPPEPLMAEATKRTSPSPPVSNTYPPPSTTEAKSVSAPPSSDFYKFFTHQKNSVLAFFDGDKKAAASSPDTAQEMPVEAPSQPAARSSETVAASAAEGPPPPPPPTEAAAGHPPGPGNDRSLNDFFSWFAIPGMYTEADTVVENYASRMGVVVEKEPKAEASRAAATATKATPSPTQSPHVHQLRPTQFFAPTLCDVCRRGVMDMKVWPPPSSSSPSSPPQNISSFFAKLLQSPTLEPSDASKATTGPADTVAARATPTPTTTTSPAATAASPVQQPFLGFGSDGYRCEVCSLALHRQCLQKLRATEACEVLAPVARSMPEATSTGDSSNSSFTWDSVKTLLGNYLDPSGGTYSRKDANVKFVLCGVYALLDTVAARYPNLTPLTFVKRRQAIQDLSTAHQSLYAACTTSLQDSELLDSITWDMIQQQERQRTAGRPGEVTEDESLAEVPCVSILTREMHPLKMDTSLFAKLTSARPTTPDSAAKKDSTSGSSGTTATTTKSSFSDYLPDFAKPHAEEVAGPGAGFPVQLLLWQALRYATAAYGDVYRRGGFSSTVSAALLFTVNRGSVDVSKSANDAAVTALLELPSSSLRLSRWTAQATEPSYVLLVDHGLGYIVVSFRGTLNTFDIMTDLAAVGVPFCGGHAHQGAAHVVNAIFDHRASQYARKPPPQPQPPSASSSATTTKDGVELSKEKDKRGATKVTLEPYTLQALETPDGLLDGLEELAAEYPTYAIVVTGHSLGGGVAVLFATRLHHDGVFPESVLRRLHVVAFAPMPTLSQPAASCFDAVSCATANGGFANRTPSAAFPAVHHDPQKTSGGVKQACFPVWSVVNGFDCVPRLQVNTIDRLLRHVVGPQIAAATTPTQPSSPSSATTSAAAARASAALMRQRCRGEGRDAAWVEVSADPTAVEMTDLSVKDTAVKGSDAASAAPAKSTGSEGQVKSDTGLASSRTTTTPVAGAAAVAPADAAEDQPLQASPDVTTVTVENTNAPETTISPATTTTASAAPTTNSKGTSEDGQPKMEEPAWATEARAQLCCHGSDESEAVVKDNRSTVAAAATTDSVAAALAEVEKVTTADGTAELPGVHDLSYELHHPGRVLLLTSPWDTTHNRLVDVPRGHPVMHELFLMKYMLLQHAVDAYCGSLAEVHTQPKEK